MRLLILILILFSSNIYSAENEDLYFVFLNSNPKAENISDSLKKDLQIRHLKNIERLFNEGILDVAGPFEGGGGIFIVHGSSKDDVLNILETDPAIAAGRFIIEVFKINIIKGNIYRVGEKYTMTTFAFVKASKNIKIENSDNAFFMGTLDNKFNILLFPIGNYESLLKEIALDDYSFIKKIWIAKESFIKGS